MSSFFQGHDLIWHQTRHVQKQKQKNVLVFKAAQGTNPHKRETLTQAELQQSQPAGSLLQPRLPASFFPRVITQLLT